MPSDDLVERLRVHVGAQSAVQIARHAVNSAAIADWCDAIGDLNPCYLDEAYAAASIHGGIVAPPATLDIWDRAGLPAQWMKSSTDDPRSVVLRSLEAAGYVGVVAVNSELEITRYLRIGEFIQNVQSLESVSEEKQTALGRGHFVTTRHRYETADGDHVGDLLFRILKFIPGTGTAAPAADATSVAPPPDPSPSLRPRPGINRDNQFLYDGYRKHELRLPRCNSCGRTFFPPSPRCNSCGAFDMGHVVVDGAATLYSFTVVHYPKVPGFRYPLPVGVVELTSPELSSPVRLVGNIVGVKSDQLKIGMPLDLEWLDSHPALVEGETDSRGSISIPQWRPSAPTRRTETLQIGDVAVGDVLPLWVMPVTPTRIVAGALSTRDFQDVHHDRDLAHAKGSADIFLNINTSIGLMQRFVSDWTGPQAMIKALRVRLGAPAYPYDHLRFTGSVTEHDPATGRVVVGVQAVNNLGPHVTGTVELELPR